MIFSGREKKRKKNNRESFGRLNFVLAIIFLFIVLILFRLFNLQVKNSDLYLDLAENQHSIFRVLSPERGRILIKDGQVGDDKTFQIATNKEFATVYGVPKDIEDPHDLSEKLYEIFDKENVELEVDELLSEDEFSATTTEENLNITRDEEFVKLKREMEIDNRREKIIERYYGKMSKKGDPYEPIARKVDDETLQKVYDLGIDGVGHSMVSHRYYPDNNIGSHIIGFYGYRGNEKTGRYGLEEFFNKELSGVNGTVKSERSADGQSIIVNSREYNPPQNGVDLLLTINRSIQFEACKALEESVISHEADGGSVVVMDPMTGAIIAMCSYPDYNPNTYNEVEDGNVYNNSVIFDAYEPGSIFKSITVAIGLDAGKITPETIYNDKGFINIKGWDKPIKNSDFLTKGGYGWVDMITVLEHSLNTGSIFIMEQTGRDNFSRMVKRFGFGEKTGIELVTEGWTTIENLERNVLRPVEMATASFGQGITATPLQMVLSYCVIANGGILMKPYIVDSIIKHSGEVQKTRPVEVRRVISQRSALITSGMMVNVVDGGHAKKAAVEGYYVAGKTGTAQVADKERGGYGDKTIHTFVGYAPVDDPKFVMLVKLDDPKDVSYSASSAAPLFGKIAEFILNYYQIPKER